MSKYLIVETSILPDIYEKVLIARKELENGKKNVSQICKELDISRSTFYKYKDKIYEIDHPIVELELYISLENKNINEIINIITTYNGKILEMKIKNNTVNILLDAFDMNITKEKLEEVLNDK